MSWNNGHKNPRAKLTMETASEIRRLFAQGEISKASLGRKFGVHRTTIQRAIDYKHWKDDVSSSNPIEKP